VGFWYGITIGVFLGANVGVFVAGLLAGCKRQKSNGGYPWDQQHHDVAVMDEDASWEMPAARPLPSAPADPLSYS